jgi:hypothetical protein
MAVALSGLTAIRFVQRITTIYNEQVLGRGIGVTLLH